jgi:hypothetical protein
MWTLCTSTDRQASASGAALAAAPPWSDIGLLRQDQGVVDLDSKVTDSALELGMSRNS